MNSNTLEQFKKVFLDMLDLVLQHPAEQNQKIVVGVLSLVAGAWVFLKVCDKFDLPNVGLFTGFIYSALGGAIMIGAMAAGTIWLGDLRRQFGDALFYSVLSCGIAILVYVPVLNSHIRGKYLGTLAAWSLAVATALAVSAMANVGFDMFRSGTSALNRGAEHNATTRDAIR